MDLLGLPKAGSWSRARPQLEEVVEGQKILNFG